jgi:hypothetical protein
MPCAGALIKYALALELTDAGFDASVLSEFRVRLITGQIEQVLLDSMLTLLQERCLLKARGYALAATRPTCWRPFGRSIG